MHYKNLTELSDFIQVLYCIRKHCAKNVYFPKHILFTTIYVLQKQKLSHRNYSEQKINMSNFVQATKHDVHIYAKFGGLTSYELL
jgi:hypothetical protein